ncbi:UNVERIFIED_CONTAM: hypothetical protein Sangu_3015200 [Sesamum angustifolium]|uniref:Uncharacterized protein n=1 Tax=Sesamum angustifolium TaxID=2727405 RepID=A0AAW2KMF2_9LAMI
MSVCGRHPLLILRATTAIPSSDDDSDTFSVLSFKTHEECGSVTAARSKNINIVPCVLGQDNSAPKDSIWGCPRFFMTTSPGNLLLICLN